MKKTAMFLGGAAVVLLATYWLGRRAGRRKALSGTGSTTVDYVFLVPRLGAAAFAQVARAEAGDWLDDYRAAEDRKLFQQAPTTNVTAYQTASYWLAVAARLSRSRALATQAGVLGAKAGAIFAIPGSSLLTGSVQSIMSGALGTLQAAGLEPDTIAPVVAALRQIGSPAAIAGAMQRQEDRAVVAGATVATGTDIAKTVTRGGGSLSFPAKAVRAFLGLSDPMGGEYPFWLRWGSRAVVLGGVGIVGALYLRPHYVAIRQMLPAAPPRQNPSSSPSTSAKVNPSARVNPSAPTLRENPAPGQV